MEFLTFQMEREHFSFSQFITPDFGKRFTIMMISVLFMGVFASILVEVGWGTDPASFMNLNISNVIHLSLGTTEVIVYGIMLIFVILFGIKNIGFGTLANMILIGYIIDFCRFCWVKTGIHTLINSGSFVIKLTFFIGSLLLFVISCSFYINAKLGVAPYDAIPQIISKHLPKVPFAIIRIFFDLSALAIGFIFSLFSKDGMQGSIIGSFIMSLLLGPTVSTVGKMLKIQN